ncbi:hypothetical protein ACOMHN_056430 [Nucella lapillus]
MGGFLRMSAILAVMAILGDWCSSAQAQEAKPALPVPVPAPPGPLGYRSCLEMRESLEGALYMSFKGTLPRRMLKELLPGLVEPLLPVMCLESGSNARKWMQQHQDLKLSALRPRLSRPKRQLNMFLPFLGGFTIGGPAGGGKVKDPGDQPPPGAGGGPNPFKDPGDRPMTFFGRPMRKIKDPQDRPPPPPPRGSNPCRPYDAVHDEHDEADEFPTYDEQDEL